MGGKRVKHTKTTTITISPKKCSNCGGDGVVRSRNTDKKRKRN